VPRTSFSYSDVFIAVELIQQLVKLDHYSVCQLSFSQLDLLTRKVGKETSGLESFVKRIHGLVRRSFSESFSRKRTNPDSERAAVYKNDLMIEDMDDFMIERESTV
jgi:hypothetical protein